MFCPDCEAWRHVAEVGSGEVIERTGAEPRVDCCWYCGHPEPTEPVITDAMINAGLKAQADALTTYTLPDLSKGPTERIKWLTVRDIVRAALKASDYHVIRPVEGDSE